MRADDCISRTRAIERLKLNLPISQGADNSRDRHRYMQAMADIQAIREMPSVTQQEPTDCVSRQFMYELGATCIATRNKNGKLIALGAIEELPSITPQEPILDKIRAEIVELTKCPYGTECLGANCPSNTDCMICGEHVLEIIDEYKADIEPQESEE